MPLVRIRGAGAGERQTRIARVNGPIGRRVVVVVVEIGSDIYLCSECRINWVHRALRQEKWDSALRHRVIALWGLVPRMRERHWGVWCCRVKTGR